MAKPWHRWPAPLQTYGQGRARVFARTQGRCAIRLPGCTGRAEALDHIIPPEEGGAWFDEGNLRGACTHCNSARSNPRSKHRNAERYGPSRDW